MKNTLLTLKNEISHELEQILAYWINHSVDNQHGGFIGHIDFNNQPVTEATKGSVLNARILWTFSAAYRLTKNEQYLQIAHRAYDYFKNHFVDYNLGGVYWEISFDGKPMNKRKQIYALSFAIYGMTEYYMACQNPEALQLAIGLFQAIEKHSFDPVQNGYFEALTEDWKPIADLRLSDKDANESKTMNTHLHILEAYTNLYRVHKTPELQLALQNLIELHIHKFINPVSYHLNLFFDDNWNLKSDAVSYGHDIECSWLLYEAAEVLDNKTLLNRVAELSVKMARATFAGMAADNGLMAEAVPSKNELDTDKHWWPQAEAMVGFFNAWEISRDQVFVDKTVQVWQFIKANIIDHKNGEWFWKVNKLNHPDEKDEKAGFWKCPYHNSRACMELMRRTEKALKV
jgi:mannobiose 2-epimerase